jgi:hypothetical protein
LPPQPLMVTQAGTVSGTVTSSPVGISCPATCTAAFAQDQSVTLTATAASGATFQGWSGEGCSGTGVCTVSMTQARTVTATFALAQGGGSGGSGGGGCTISPGGGFNPTLVGVMGLALTHLYWRNRRRRPSCLLKLGGRAKNPNHEHCDQRLCLHRFTSKNPGQA